MALSSSTLPAALAVLLCLAAAAVAVAVAVASAHPQLTPTFYDASCPRALATIKAAVDAAVGREPRMGASLLRLHFHDCFVQGCDASVLLTDIPGRFVGEQGANGNVGSLRGFDVVDNIKAQVEALCRQTVSCADILAVAARDSVVSLGGSPWTVPLGRRDSTTASKDLANSDLPPPFFNVNQLTKSFSDKGLSVTDMVALSGAHTIGQAQCTNFKDRLYNETTTIDPSYAAALKSRCPRPASSADTSVEPLDTTTPNTFDNRYFSNLISSKGLLHSDQVLLSNAGGSGTDNTVRNFASNPAAFSSAFSAAMVRMGNIAPLTGTQGQIRTTCSRVN